MVPKPTTLRNGRYTLLRTIGSGSQAETYEARDNGASALRPVPGRLREEWERHVARARRGVPTNFEALVAVKAFQVGRAKAWKDVELAEREARTLASLTHPNLPRYIEHFEEAGALYLVMEKVEGESLAELRKLHRIASASEVSRMLRDMAEALRYLHGRAPAVVHRDIKPGNVLRRFDGSYALVDFGAVSSRMKPQGGSTVVGTFGYMAPEQFQGRASPKSDLYGLGATALVMLTGREPEDLPHIGLGIDVAQAVPETTPKPLQLALSRMLHPDPDERIGSIDEVLALLDGSNDEACLRGSGPTSKAEDETEEAEKKRVLARALGGAFEPTKHEKRDKRKATRDAKRRRRAAARERRPPFVPRMLGQFALMTALLAVWLVLGVAVPSLLLMLSLFFGRSLRAAAVTTKRAATHSQLALQRGSAWLSGYRPDKTDATGRIRVNAAALGLRVSSSEASDAGVAPPEPLSDDIDLGEETSQLSNVAKEVRRRKA